MTDIVDLTVMRTITDGDEEIERELFSYFISDSEESLAKMEENCVDGENEPWSNHAHALKGAAQNLGCDALASLCCKAQDMKTATKEERDAMFAEIKKTYLQVKEFLGTVWL